MAEEITVEAPAVIVTPDGVVEDQTMDGPSDAVNGAVEGLNQASPEPTPDNAVAPDTGQPPPEELSRDATEYVGSDSMGVEEEFIEHFKAQQPGYEQLFQMETAEKARREQEIMEQAQAREQQLRSKGTAPTYKQYAYEEMIRNGDEIKESEAGGAQIPNKYIRPRQVEIAGFDFSTGEQVRSVLPEAGDHIHEALAALRSSEFDTKDGAPPKDVVPISQFAYEFINHGYGYDEFASAMPPQYTEEMKREAYRVADDYAAMNEAYEELTQKHGTYIPDTTEAWTPPDWTVTDRELMDSEQWMQAARVVYKAMSGKEFEGEDAELFDLSKKFMSQFNWNTWKMLETTRLAVNGKEDLQKSILYMMQAYDAKEANFDDILNNMISLGADPMTYMSLGFGKMAYAAMSQIAKRRVISSIMRNAGTASIVGAGEGAVYGSFDDLNRQYVEKAGGAREEISPGQTAAMAGGTAVIGAALGPAVLAVAKWGEKALERIDNSDFFKDPPNKQRGYINIDPRDHSGRGVSSIDIIDQPEPPFIPEKDSYLSPNKQVGRYLQNRSRNYLGERNVSVNTPENRAYVANVLAREVKAEILKDKKKGRAPSFQWYQNTLEKARATVGEVHPEILTDESHRSAFDFALAITSNGETVDSNSKLGLAAYEHWKATGRMPSQGSGKRAPAQKQAFDLYNALVDTYGQDEVNRLLATEFRVGDLKKAGFDISGESVDEMLPFSAIFGPKVGGGFYPNLQGDWDRLTPDVWFTRTWGRVTGTLLEANPELAAKHFEDFKAAYTPEAKRLLKSYGIEAPNKSDLTPEIVDELGSRIFAKWSRAKGPKGESFPDKSNPMHTLSRAIDIRLKPREAPANGAERMYMRQTVREVSDLLKKDGLDVHPSSIQAALWYPEQRLWDQLGSKQRSPENDYASAFDRLLAGDSRRTRVQDGAGGTEVGAAGPITEEERRAFTKRETLRTLRAGPRGTGVKKVPEPVFGGTGKGSGLLQLDAKVAQVHKPSKAAANKLSEHNIPTHSWNELEPGLDSAIAFGRAILAADKKALAIAPQPGDLANAKLFVTDNGKSGFAIKPDGEIVAMFDATRTPNNAIAALLLAVQNGGRKITTFDTIQPDIYSEAGFKAVRREPFPEGKDPIPVYGKPDVIHMEYDPSHNGRYDPEDVPGDQ